MRWLHIKTPMSGTPNFFSPFKIIFFGKLPKCQRRAAVEFANLSSTWLWWLWRRCRRRAAVARALGSLKVQTLTEYFYHQADCMRHAYARKHAKKAAVLRCATASSHTLTHEIVRNSSFLLWRHSLDEVVQFDFSRTITVSKDFF